MKPHIVLLFMGELFKTAAVVNMVWIPSKINHLNRDIVRFLATTEAREKYLIPGAEVVGSSPEEHVAKLKSRLTTIGKLIKDAGIKVN